MDKEKLKAMADIVHKVRSYQGWNPQEVETMKSIVVEWVRLFNKFGIEADEYSQLLDQAIQRRITALRSGERAIPLSADYILSQSEKSHKKFLW